MLLRPQDEEMFRELNDELRVQLDVGPRVIEASGIDGDQLRELLLDPPDDIVLVKALEAWSDSAFRSLDINRSKLERPGFVILWIARSGAERLLRYAPNLASWIGGSAFDIDPDLGLMTDEERRTRLAEMSRHYKLNDEDVIRMAQSGKLPSAPHFTEWLILLGRSDLAR